MTKIIKIWITIQVLIAASLYCIVTRLELPPSSTYKSEIKLNYYSILEACLTWNTETINWDAIVKI